MSGPAGVLALVLAETAAGGALFLWLMPLWGTVRRGFFTLTGAILLVVALAAWGSANAATKSGGSAAPQTWALALSAAIGVSTLLLLFRRDRVGRWAGLATVPAALGTIVAFGLAGDGSRGVALFQVAAGAAFMGAVTDGLLLGHWYLVDRGLTRRPINLFAVGLLATVAVETVAVAIEGFGQSTTSNEFSSLLTAAGIRGFLAVGMVLATGLIGVMIRITLRGDRSSAVQAATGFFYLAVITAFAGDLAARTSFLPPR